MQQQKKINVKINDGDEFFAHELSINYNPTQFVFDFRCVTPRTDVRSRDSPVLNIKHNTVITEAWHAKEILKVLKNVITNYEKQFGEIKVPDSVIKLREKNEKSRIDKEQSNNDSESSNDTKTQAPSYLG